MLIRNIHSATFVQKVEAVVLSSTINKATPITAGEKHESKKPHSWRCWTKSVWVTVTVIPRCGWHWLIIFQAGLTKARDEMFSTVFILRIYSGIHVHWRIMLLCQPLLWASQWSQLCVDTLCNEDNSVSMKTLGCWFTIGWQTIREHEELHSGDLIAAGDEKDCMALLLLEYKCTTTLFQQHVLNGHIDEGNDCMVMVCDLGQNCCDLHAAVW